MMKAILLVIFGLFPLLAFPQVSEPQDDEAIAALTRLSQESVAYYRAGKTDSANACFEKIAALYNTVHGNKSAAQIVHLPLSIYLYSKSITAKADILGLTNYTWRDVQRSLHDDDIAIEFIDIPTANGRWYSAISLCKGDTLPKVNGMFYETQIHEIANVWEKLSPRLRGKKNIYFAPIDVLHWMPIEYSPDVDTFRVYRLTTTRELVDREKPRREIKSAALFGYDDQLFYTKDEVDTIGNTLSIHRIPYKIYSDNDATERAFKSLSGNAPTILHIATHGFVWNGNKGNNILESNTTGISEEDSILNLSGLLLASSRNNLRGDSTMGSTDDGFLTSREISELDLHGVDLVVLSGCDTGIGAPMWGEGIYGLQRAFKKAGAKTILMSTNRVDDRATELLMCNFYRHLLSGETKRDALFHAQSDVCNYEGGIYSAPKYWMNFILIDALD